MTVPRMMVASTINILKDMISEQQDKGEGMENNKSAIPPAIERLEKKH
jgi:hypothetical protein